ncbi:hypothetical protein A3Q56_02220 [Intoshia linei]|uniref:Eukaryotic translation initiation factor 2 subunit 1 n=1 Tax=Intoshia linei TaxID=1819745 RepID=A0A177B7A2_9BILA|nr:hypothetical protein A3Q56_02220 [Intoshia linei]
MKKLDCRFYEKKFPSVDEIVKVKVRSIADMGAYVELLEYNNIEGMILLSELSRRRIRSINKLIRVGRLECVVVIRVDEDKGYIDLSKRRASPEEIQQCEVKYAEAKTVNSIICHVASKLDYDNDQLEKLYNNTAWFVDRKYKRIGTANEVFKHITTNKAILDDFVDINPEEKDMLLKVLSHRLAAQILKVRADIDVACFGSDGIHAVKDALNAGKLLSNDSMKININLIAPPLYSVSSQYYDSVKCVQVIGEVLDKIKEKIESYNLGTFTIKMPPKVVTDFEQIQLEKYLEKLEEENREVSGDENDSEFESGED